MDDTVVDDAADNTASSSSIFGDDSGAGDDTATGISVGGGTEGNDKSFVEFVVKQLVDDSSAVIVKRKVDDLGVFITVSVSKNDMGKLIGKNGQTVDALRVLLRVIGAKENNRVNLKVVEPEEL